MALPPGVRPCSKCDGTGRFGTGPCNVCGGTGHHPQQYVPGDDGPSDPTPPITPPTKGPAKADRAQTIRSRTAKERTRLAELNAKLGDDLKQMLKPALSSLDDVEMFFLDGNILNEPRTPAALARWLDAAERVTQQAVQQREKVEELAKKFGANARIVKG